jgi:hypothetical protein
MEQKTIISLLEFEHVKIYCINAKSTCTGDRVIVIVHNNTYCREVQQKH